MADLTREQFLKRIEEHPDADLGGWDLSGIDLSLTNLQEVDLTGANLAGASLRGAMAYHAKLTRAYMRGADLC